MDNETYKEEKFVVILNNPKEIWTMFPFCQNNLHRKQPNRTSNTLSTKFEI